MAAAQLRANARIWPPVDIVKGGGSAFSRGNKSTEVVLSNDCAIDHHFVGSCASQAHKVATCDSHATELRKFGELTEAYCRTLGHLAKKVSNMRLGAKITGELRQVGSAPLSVWLVSMLAISRDYGQEV